MIINEQLVKSVHEALVADQNRRADDFRGRPYTKEEDLAEV